MAGNRLVDRLGKDGKCGRSEILVIHVAGHDFVVVVHSRDHQVLDQLPEAKLEFVEGI